jgi:predicted phosphodiesterase
MRLVIISDTHGKHNLIGSLPEGDVLAHAGDFMNSGLFPDEILSFNRWLGEQPIKHRVVCGGNHDRLLFLRTFRVADREGEITRKRAPAFRTMVSWFSDYC